MSLDLGFGQRLKTCCEETTANIEFYNGGNALNLLHFENFHLLLLNRNRNKSRFVISTLLFVHKVVLSFDHVLEDYRK